jgi:LTXXQ motif family protein
MSPLKTLIAAASISAFCVPAAYSEPAPDGAGAGQHAWHMPSKEEMAAWHAQHCKDRYAREAGKLAYLEAALSITDSQRGAFDQWRDAMLTNAKSHSDQCLAHTPGDHHMADALERSAGEQKRLEARLASLQSERPVLEAFYQTLTPDQKKLFDRMGDHRHGDHGEHHEGHGDHAHG